MEAEDLILDGYKIFSGSYASEGEFIRVSRRKQNGSASTVFDGVEGNYQLKLGYFDENDGASEITVKVDGNVVETWRLDDNNTPGGKPYNNSSSETFTEYTLEPIVSLNSGSTIEIIGSVDGKEWARIDYLEWIPADGEVTPPPADTINPTASISADDVSLVEGSDSSYQFNVTYDDNVGIDQTSLDNSDIRVTGANGFDQLATFVSANASDNGIIATYQVDAPGGIWETSEAGNYNISIVSNQVSDSNGNFVAGGITDNFGVQVTTPTPPTEPPVSGDTDGILINLALGLSFDSHYDEPIRIMPLGDSITYGVVAHPDNRETGGYRRYLWHQLEELGVETDFVGSVSSGPDDFDNDHNGYGGRTINWLTNDNWSSRGGHPQGLTGSLQDEQPNTVLVMAGTNDTSNDSVTQMVSDLHNLIEKITNLAPDAEVLVAEIPPIRPEASTTRAQKAEDFNAEIPGIVDHWASQGRKVTLVSTDTLTVDDISTLDVDNGLHPTEGGHEKIAQAFYDALLDTVGDTEVLSDLNNAVGTEGDDKIIGSDGVNVIEGGAGNDLLTGGGSSDTFVYNTANEGLDTITDFGDDDLFSISASGFGGGLSAGINLSTTASTTGVFVSDDNPTSLGSSANFLYNTTTGVLSFDVDGVGTTDAVDLVALDSNPNLSADQFNIFA